MDMVLMGQQLELVILEVFSNLYNFKSENLRHCKVKYLLLQKWAQKEQNYTWPVVQGTLYNAMYNTMAYSFSGLMNCFFLCRYQQTYDQT